MTRDERFIQQALRMAEDIEEHGDARVFSILTIGNKIISYGFNSPKSHPIATRFDKREGAIFPHAEVLAIHNASKRIDFADFRRTTLYVARVKKAHKGAREYIPGLSKPCPGCQATINSFNIRRVVYTTNDNTCGCWLRGYEW